MRTLATAEKITTFAAVTTTIIIALPQQVQRFCADAKTFLAGLVHLNPTVEMSANDEGSVGHAVG